MNQHSQVLNKSIFADLPHVEADLTYIVRPREKPINAPRPEIMIDRFPSRELMGHHTPSAASTKDIEDTIENFRLMHTARATTLLKRMSEEYRI